MSPRKTSKSKARPGSLLSPEAMGGITAGKGFGFQTRYAVCQLPVWLLDPAFHQLFHEGTGDIDIRYAKGKPHDFETVGLPWLAVLVCT